MHPDDTPQAQMLEDARTLWNFHQISDQPRTTDIAIALGSHDIGVAEHAAALFHADRYPMVVFTGANSPTTIDRFPRGEAVEFAERVPTLDVPTVWPIAFTGPDGSRRSNRIAVTAAIHPTVRPTSSGPTPSARSTQR